MHVSRPISKLTTFVPSFLGSSGLEAVIERVYLFEQ
jgi:hypothetical protein